MHALKTCIMLLHRKDCSITYSKSIPCYTRSNLDHSLRSIKYLTSTIFLNLIQHQPPRNNHVSSIVSDNSCKPAWPPCLNLFDDQACIFKHCIVDGSCLPAHTRAWAGCRDLAASVPRYGACSMHAGLQSTTGAAEHRSAWLHLQWVRRLSIIIPCAEAQQNL